MYFPIGWPKFFNAKLLTGNEDCLKILRFNRPRSLFVTISNTCVYLWKTKPRLIIATWRRDEKSIGELGENKDVFWSPDSSMLAIVTDGGIMILLDLFEVEKEYIYHLQPANGQSSNTKSLAKIELAINSTVTLEGDITSVSPRIDELFITTTEGWIYRLSWNGEIKTELSSHIADLLFCVDLDTPATGAPLANNSNIYIDKIECSPVLGGFAIILSDGRGGFLSSSTPDARTEDIVGIFAKDLTDAVSIAVNIKYQIIVFGQTNGQCVAYSFDDITGGLIVSHRYILPKKDYPDQGAQYGSVTKLSWTPDGCALATLWSNSGIAVWSVFGALLMCVQTADHSGDVFHHAALPINSMDWGFEGYELLLIPNIELNQDKHDVSPGDILEMKFVKSALAVNPCMSNRQHLFLQGDDSVYLNTGDVMLQSTQGPILDGNGNGMNSPSMHFSNKHWQTFQVPSSYISTNWPLRYAAIDDVSKYLAVAGIYGYAHFSLARRRWKLFGNETQEKNVTCRGGLTWWDKYLIVGCYNFIEEVDEIRLHNRQSNLDVLMCQRVKVNAPIFLINTFNDVLLIYCADCTVTFYKMQLVESLVHVSGVTITKMSETTLIDYLIHPITVTSLSLTGLRNEQFDSETEDREAHSMIANVAGKVFMLQKDKPASERANIKVQFLAPVVLASCVENIWYMVNPNSTKQHLAESLWLACGAQGMQAWLPLYPARRPLGFLSKRIMLHFNLQLYPLAVLFEDAVILGIGNEDVDDCMTPSPIFGASMPFPYFSLERTTQVYLPQILKQLLRRNLGVHALDIARSCTNLPYFTHVLELMLHEVLEKEATASNPIPDPLLPRIVEFIQEFPQFLETVCHCARKTEVALWPHLFSVVGDPIELFKSCHSTRKLETAGSYLLIIQSLETPAVSRQYATMLLETALENHKWELAQDLVRFLRAIGQGENESPPRTPLYFGHKSSFHQNMSSNMMTSANLDDSMSGTAGPVMIPLQRQNSRSLSSTGVSNKLTSTNSKERANSVKDKPRPTNLKLKKESSEKSSTSKPVTVESCEHFFTELILGRFARKLLSESQLNDLGTFAASLQFDLIGWLTKERYRAAYIDDMVKSFSSIHEQFEWPYPCKTSMEQLSLQLDSQYTISQRLGELSIPNDITTPTTPLGSEISFPNTTGDDIEARLIAMKDDISVVTGTEAISDTCSFVTLDELASDTLIDDSCNNVIEIQKLLEEKQQKGPPQSLAKLKYLLEVFVEARCLDWIILLSLILLDLTSFKVVLEKVSSFQDMSHAKLESLLTKLNLLNEWLETNCDAYQPILSTIIANCETLRGTISDDTEPSAHVAVTSVSATEDNSRSAAEACVTPRQSSDANENVCDTADDTCTSKEDVTVEDEEAQGECVIT